MNSPVTDTPLLVIRQTRAGYILAGIFLFLALLILAIALARGSVHGLGDAIIAVLFIGGAALLGIDNFLSAAVAGITVDGETVQVRDQLGRRRRFRRGDVDHAAKVSILAPSFGLTRTTALLLVGKDGRYLARVAESDYGEENLERLVATLGLAEPHLHELSVHQINRQFPGAYAFDFQRVAIALMVLLTLALAVGAVAVRCG